MKMNRTTGTHWLLGGLLFFFLDVAALGVQANTQEPRKPSYEEMVAKAKIGDPDLDFAALRYAFLESSSSTHKGGFYNSKELNGLAQRKDYDALLKKANEFIEMDFVDIRGHFFAGYALHALGREEESQKEMALAKGLVKSIHDSGDGKTQKTAYVVINTAEEYALLEWDGIRATQQALAPGGKDLPMCDVLTGTRGNQPVTVYFDITKFFGKHL